jgi:hypothetical protein
LKFWIILLAVHIAQALYGLKICKRCGLMETQGRRIIFRILYFGAPFLMLILFMVCGAGKVLALVRRRT